MNKEQLIQAVQQAGIVGEGGAGFPAHVKYACAPEVIIANGCECEPLLHTDLHIMLAYTAELCNGMTALKNALGAQRAIIAVKRKNKTAVSALQAFISAHTLPLEVAALDDFYPAGDEQTLVHEVLGRSIPPLGLPIHVGALVANVGTLVNVARALGLHGKSPEPVTHKILTVTGEVKKPGVLRVPVGTSLSLCLEACGGSAVQDPVFIIGGPMMGRMVTESAAFADEVVTKTTGGLIVLPRGHYLHMNATVSENVMRKRSASACIQCRTCSEMCPRMLIGHPFATHKVMRAFAAGNEVQQQAATVAHMCCECGLCEHYACPMGLAPRRINQRVKNTLRAAGVAYTGTKEVVPGNTVWRAYRKTPVSRLAARIGIGPYMPLETPYLGELAPTTVTIVLRQHIGAPAVPVVKQGDTVVTGQLIAAIAEKALGAALHASVTGTVVAVTDSAVIIETQRGTS